MEKLQINLEFTPNPDSLKYSVNRELLSKAPLHFESATEAENSGLAKTLFHLDGVSGVMIGKNFVSVRFSNQEDLQALNSETQNLIHNFLESGEPIVDPQFLLQKSQSNTKTYSQIEEKIIQVLDEHVRPAVAQDGGDIVFEKYEDGFVYLKMQGSCAGCPSSLMTLKMGVEGRLKDEIPEIKEVIPV